MVVRSVFLAGPFKQNIDETGGLPNRHVAHIETLAGMLQRLNLKVDNAHRRENWGHAMMTPTECTQADYQAIRSADLLIADPGMPASPGTHIELGWASAMQKPIILLLEKPLTAYAYLVRGLSEITNITVVNYTDTEDCCQKLQHVMNDYMEDNEHALSNI